MFRMAESLQKACQKLERLTKAVVPDCADRNW